MTWWSWTIVVVILFLGSVVWARRTAYREVCWIITTEAEWHNIEIADIHLWLGWGWPFRRAVDFNVAVVASAEEDQVDQMLQSICAQLDQRYGDGE